MNGILAWEKRGLSPISFFLFPFPISFQIEEGVRRVFVRRFPFCRAVLGGSNSSLAPFAAEQRANKGD